MGRRRTWGGGNLKAKRKREQLALSKKTNVENLLEKETENQNLNLLRRMQTLVCLSRRKNGKQRKGNRERRKKERKKKKSKGRQSRERERESGKKTPKFLFLQIEVLSASSFTLSCFHVGPLPPALPVLRALALPHFLRQPATMQSAVTRATTSAPAAARSSAGGAIAAAPRPSVSAAAPRRSVQTNAVKEVIMPALSSTMTEGKVRLFLSPGAVVRRREGGAIGEREREKENSVLFFSTLLSLVSGQ